MGTALPTCSEGSASTEVAGHPGADRDLLRDDDGNLYGPTESISVEEYERRYPRMWEPDLSTGASDSDAPTRLAVVAGQSESGANTGLTVAAGLALVGLAVGAVAVAASSSRNRKKSRRELEWRIAGLAGTAPKSPSSVTALLRRPAGNQQIRAEPSLRLNYQHSRHESCT